MKLIKINYLTYYFLIIFFMCGFIKNAILIFCIVFVHELGHVFASYINGYKILSINIYPFGGITKLEKEINSPLLKDFFLSISGILFQIFLCFIFIMLNYFGIISTKTLNLFLFYNNMIMFFNILPIEPLDGSQMLDTIFNNFFSYKKSLYLKIVISIIFLTIFLLYNYTYSLNNYMVITFLVFKIYEHYKNIDSLYNKFLLERYLNIYDHFYIRHEEKLCLDNLKKNSYHYFWNNNAWLSEKNAIHQKLNRF